jgi:negative regulator of flagellin synthesis FlgM
LKIDNSSKPVAQTKATRTSGPAAAKKGGAAAAKGRASASAQDKVEINPLSSQLQALETTLEQVEVVDNARVEAVRKAISEGRFRVNPDAIADRLIATVKEMVLSRKG